MLRQTALAMLLSASPALGQGQNVAPARSNIDFAHEAWRQVHGNLVKAATAAPDSLFAYKPTPGVRSFGETLDHVAASERGYCQMALGEQPSGGGAGTGARNMAAVIAALQAAAEVCERAYRQSEAEAILPAYGGGRTSRLQVLLENAMHDSEHYGNIVTYLRLNGMVPPTSQPSSR